MADENTKKKITLSDLLQSVSAEPTPNTEPSPRAPVVFARPTVTKSAAPATQPTAVVQPPPQPAKSIVPPPAQVQPQAQEQSWPDRIFGSSKVEPGEYSTGRNIGTGVVQFLGNFGNSISGNAALNPALNQAFAQQRQEYMDRDPNSRSSKLYRGMATSMGLPIRGDETAYNLREQMPNVKEFLMARQMQMRGQGGGGAPKTPGAEQQKIISNSAMALNGVLGMGNALKKGTNTFSLIGDNDFTNARRSFVEGIGRLQSGGLIGKEEAENYEAMAPKATDSAKQQQDKLRALEAELKSRLELAGADPEQVLGKRAEATAASQVKYVKDRQTGKTLKVNGLGEILE